MLLLKRFINKLSKCEFKITKENFSWYFQIEFLSNSYQLTVIISYIGKKIFS